MDLSAPSLEDPTVPPQKIIVDPSLRTVAGSGSKGVDAPAPEVIALMEDRFKNFAVENITHVVIQ